MQIQYELQLLSFSWMTGVWLMMCYDIFRVVRIMIPHGNFWIGLEDLVYWIYASMVTFSLLYRQNDGNLRAFVIVGIFVGMLLYDRLFSRTCFRVLKKVIGCFKMKAKKCEK